jgi:hypothetical protein
MSRTMKATAAPHRATCPCGKCVHRRRAAGLAEPTAYESAREERLAKRAEALRRAIYLAQRSVDRGRKLLAKVAPAQKAPGKPGDPMQAIRDAIARGELDEE